MICWRWGRIKTPTQFTSTSYANLFGFFTWFLRIKRIFTLSSTVMWTNKTCLLVEALPSARFIVDIPLFLCIVCTAQTKPIWIADFGSNWKITFKVWAWYSIFVGENSCLRVLSATYTHKDFWQTKKLVLDCLDKERFFLAFVTVKKLFPLLCQISLF